MTCTIIAAVSPDGVIGLDGRLPWHYAADLKRFKRLTTGGTVIMGRLTWESLPRRPLPHRRNLVVTSRPQAICPGPDRCEVECFSSLEAALAASAGEVWLIGGARLFAAGMRLADRIDLTYVPDRVATDGQGVVLFPTMDERVWRPGPKTTHEGDSRLTRRIFLRRELLT